jgi:hypothetical protein
MEAYVGQDDTATAQAALTSVGITPVTRSLDVDLGALVTSLDPTGGFFGHDKIEGVATTDGGRTILVRTTVSTWRSTRPGSPPRPARRR